VSTPPFGNINLIPECWGAVALPSVFLIDYQQGKLIMRLRRHIVGLLLFALMGEGAVMVAFGENSTMPTVSRVEVVLAQQYRAREAELKREFAEAGLTNVHFQFARMGQPPQNIGLGRDVKYNGGVGILLPDRLFPPRFITIASSNYDDTVEYPISRDTLAKLQDPALSTEAFHRLYRDLTSAVIDPKGRY
jgi:hypothetical protein